MSAAGESAWDYSALASHYELRAPYAEAAVAALLDEAGVARDAAAVDIGAGTGRLTRFLAARGHRVTAVEPCAPMRAIGEALGAAMPVCWHAADGCRTGLADACAQLVGYGSSFNVLPPAAAIGEALRLLGGAGHVLLLWNHRDLDDPQQARVEALLRRHAPAYQGGRRRADPLPDWRAVGVLEAVHARVARIVVRQPVDDFVDGFRAHGTLLRCLEGDVAAVLAEMHAELADACADGYIEVPFDTRAWCLRVRR